MFLLVHGMNCLASIVHCLCVWCCADRCNKKLISSACVRDNGVGSVISVAAFS